jgi:hypothetical protein
MQDLRECILLQDSHICPQDFGLSRLAPSPQDQATPHSLSKFRLQGAGDVVILVTHRFLPYAYLDVRVTLEEDTETHVKSLSQGVFGAS